MSLFLGNLTPRIRRDEVEHVFHRFGRCNIQLKEGYGFVHYDLPGNAEKALRALRGRNISGEPISLTWANKQPKSFRRNMRGSRFYEPNGGRGFMRREDYGMRRINSHDQRGFKMVSKQTCEKDDEIVTNDFLGKEMGQSGNDIEDHEGEKIPIAKETLLDQDISIEPNIGENGRWGESASNPFDGNEVANGMTFERYEPYQGYDGVDEDKDHPVTNSHGSPALGSLGGKSWRECSGDATSKPPDNPEPPQRCFNCGKIGHIKRNCPQADTYGQEKSTRFNRRQENDASYRVRGRKELKSLRTEPRGKSNPSGSLPSSKRHKRDRKSSSAGKSRRLIISENNTPALKETRRSPLRRDSQRKKKHRQDVGGSMKYHRGRRGKVSGSSSRHSNSTASSLLSHSHSPSRATSPTSRSTRSRSRSVSSKSRSISSSSRSRSSSSYSRSKSSRSNSRSRTRSPSSFSLSVSLGKPLTSSPNKALAEETSASPKSYLENTANHKHKRLLTGEGQPAEGDANLEIYKWSRNETPAEENIRTFKLGNEICNNHPELWDEDVYRSYQQTEFEPKHPCVTPPENGAFASNNLSSENQVEKRDIEHSQPAATVFTQVPVEKLNPDVVSSHIKNPSTISSQEMHMVLNHYGLDMSEENERNLPVEAYFGSARLWPWEIVYYRRLKKGPISVENYARRIAQNEEFGIVDKYIRSSSGWGACDHSNS